MLWIGWVTYTRFGLSASVYEGKRIKDVHITWRLIEKCYDFYKILFFPDSEINIKRCMLITTKQFNPIQLSWEVVSVIELERVLKSKSLNLYHCMKKPIYLFTPAIHLFLYILISLLDFFCRFYSWKIK